MLNHAIGVLSCMVIRLRISPSHCQDTNSGTTTQAVRQAVPLRQAWHALRRSPACCCWKREEPMKTAISGSMVNAGSLL